jgi:chorismate mutase
VIPKAFAAAKALASLMGWAPLTGQALASIEDPAVIKQILAHLQRKAESKEVSAKKIKRLFYCFQAWCL